MIGVVLGILLTVAVVAVSFCIYSVKKERSRSAELQDALQKQTEASTALQAELVDFHKYANSVDELVKMQTELTDFHKYAESAAKYNSILQTQHSETTAKLTKEYSEKEKELNNKLLALKTETDKKVEDIQHTLSYYEDLEKTVVQNKINEEAVRLNRNFYRIDLDSVELNDISTLRPIAVKISKPVIMYKLLYEVYYKPKLDIVFKRVLEKAGAMDLGGIYKITNITNDKIYIGRAVKFLDRWRQHAKCGVGADTGSLINAKLYDAMKEEGLENFTFEVLDVCPKEDQAAREKYWVDYYKSIEYGYNVKGGG